MKKIYGLLGRNINYSFSPLLHNFFFDRYKISGTYELFNREPENIEEIIHKLKNKEIAGINVTIPYKEEVIKYLDIVTPEAKAIGAVNTVVFENNKLIGYNTDYFGFLESVKKMNLHCENKEIYILGTGGASKAVLKVIEDLKGIPILVSRTPDKIKNSFPCEIIDYELLKSRKGYLIINCTPVGTYPEIDKCPIPTKLLENFDFAIDLIYNPRVTKFLKHCKKGMNGFYMLVAQGIKAQEIWQKKTFNLDDIYEELEKKWENL